MKAICYECLSEINVEETHNGFVKCWLGFCLKCDFSRDYYSEKDLINKENPIDKD